nr:MAG TPA: hypothetical protein [Caudoviricetes sp.]
MGQPYATVTHPTKPMLCGVLTDTGHMWYTRTHVPICIEKTLGRP